MSSPAAFLYVTDVDEHVKFSFDIISYAILNKELREMIRVKNDVGHEIRKVVKRIGHEIKEVAELAEHETGINNAKSTFSKIKKGI